MKWILKKKDDDVSIYAKIQDSDEETAFSYIEMIRTLYDRNKIDSIAYEGDFSEKEKESVQSLADDINRHVEVFLKNDEYNKTEDFSDLN